MRKKGRAIHRMGKTKETLKKVGTGALSVFAGAANSMFGGGGGMFVVPAMNRFLGLEERAAHASAIAVILPLSVISAVAYTIRGVWDVSLGITVSVGATVGGAVGAFLLKKIPKNVLSFLFYAVMIYAGIKILR